MAKIFPGIGIAVSATGPAQFGAIEGDSKD
jgi:hypothetical protein